MIGIPIDEAALEKAEKVYVGHIESRFDTSLSDDIRVLVSAYLEAVGATVEERAVDLIGLEIPGPPNWSRVIFPWKPLTDTEEERPTTTPIEVCRDCGWNMATSDGYCRDCVAPDTEEER